MNNPSAPSATQRTQSEDMKIKHAVMEFLTYHNMTNTKECFEIESQQKLKQTNAVVNSPRSGPSSSGNEGVRFRVKRDMLACFEDGLSNRFFASWDKNVPMDLRNKDKTCQKLEFYVQLHFATLPFRPAFLRKTAAQNGANGARSAAGAAASAMLGFRKYLESRGKTLSNSPEFLQYYALPYVPNPRDHPSFKGVFKPQWPLDIRVRVERFLEVVLQSVTLPELYSIFDVQGRGGGGDGGGGGGGGNQQYGGHSTTALGNAMAVPGGHHHHQNNHGNRVSQADVRNMKNQMQDKFMQREEKLKDFARNIYSVSVEMLRELERSLQGGQGGQGGDGEGEGDAAGGGSVRPEFVVFAKSRLDMFSEVLSQKGLTSTSQALSNMNAKNNNSNNNTNALVGGKDDGGKEDDGAPANNLLFDYSAVRDDLAKLADLIVEHNATEDTMSRYVSIVCVVCVSCGVYVLCVVYVLCMCCVLCVCCVVHMFLCACVVYVGLVHMLHCPHV